MTAKILHYNLKFVITSITADFKDKFSTIKKINSSKPACLITDSVITWFAVFYMLLRKNTQNLKIFKLQIKINTNSAAIWKR